MPDFRGFFLRGVGGNSAALGITQYDELKSHAHTGGSVQGSYQYGADTQYGDDDPYLIGVTGYTGGIETRPMNKSVRYFVRAKP